MKETVLLFFSVEKKITKHKNKKIQRNSRVIFNMVEKKKNVYLGTLSTIFKSTFTVV